MLAYYIGLSGVSDCILSMYPVYWKITFLLKIYTVDTEQYGEFVYCYDLLNVISLTLHQSDHNKQLLINN